MSEPVKIVIVVEGGCIQSVLSAGVPVEFVLVDYDTEGAEPGALADVPQDGGHAYPAVVTLPAAAEAAGPFVLGAFARFGDEWQAAQWECFATYATTSGNMGSATLIVAADSGAEACSFAAGRLMRDKRRHYAGKLDITARRLNPPPIPHT